MQENVVFKGTNKPTTQWIAAMTLSPLSTTSVADTQPTPYFPSNSWILKGLTNPLELQG